jgi:hypothetical protein
MYIYIKQYTRTPHSYFPSLIWNLDFGKSRLIPKIDTKLLLQFLLGNTNGMYIYIYIYYVNIKACVYHVVLKKSKYSTIYFYNINIYFKLSLGQIWQFSYHTRYLSCPKNKHLFGSTSIESKLNRHPLL